MLKCKRRTSAFKEREEPSGESSRLAYGVLHAYLLDCLHGEGFNYRLLLLPGQLDSVLSPLIVLATVVSLYVPFALSSDRHYLQAIFWTSLFLTEKLNSFSQSKITYCFPFRETPSTYHKPEGLPYKRRKITGTSFIL
jgi:hypothetical protein